MWRRALTVWVCVGACACGSSATTPTPEDTASIDTTPSPDAEAAQDAGPEAVDASAQDAGPEDAGPQDVADVGPEATIDAPTAEAVEDADAAAETASDAAVALDATGEPDLGPQDVPYPYDVDAAALADACKPECPSDGAKCSEAGERVPCVSDDTGCSTWGAPKACEAGHVCSAGACVPACPPEATHCLDLVTLQTCSAGKLTQMACPFGCDAATKACVPCPPGAARCVATGGGFQLQLCNAGKGWSTQSLCGACSCKAQGAAVSMVCIGANELPTSCKTCDSDGKGCAP
jgi:hypothetical protein